MDTKALRQKILDLAIRGKLVPQDPNDEPASVLLGRIRAKKKQLVKEGKLKAKDIKNDTVIYVGEDNLHYEKFHDGTVKCIEDELPFEVPDGWAWCRYSHVIELYSGQDLTSNRYNNIGEGIPYITGASNLKHGKVIINRWTTTPTTHATIGDLLLTVKGSGVGKMAFCDIADAHIARQIMALRCTNAITPQYLHIAISAMLSDITAQANGIIPGIRREIVLGAYLPLPPINEQYKICEIAYNSLHIIDIIDGDKDELKKAIQTTKSKMLDLAIRGKLVPQDPNDEPASVLLERIHEEKEKLIKQGKIKRNKKESVIFRGDDNSYYESVNKIIVPFEQDALFNLPANWTWCRIRNIASVQGGKRLPKGTDFSDTLTDHAYIRVADMKNRTVNATNLKYISDDVYEQIKSYTISSKDLYVTIAGTIGVVGEVPDSLDGMNLTENAVKICNIAIDKEYLCYILLSSFVQHQFQDKTHQVAMPKLALERILTTLIPLPPLDEQKKIVNAVNKCIFRLNSIQELLA